MSALSAFIVGIGTGAIAVTAIGHILDVAAGRRTYLMRRSGLTTYRRTTCSK
ncbi:MAG: hypothetical protein JXP37_08555 [Coriobacteriia bacterium]|nr:hypothetical protein [Coriobacteriia bacterium]